MLVASAGDAVTGLADHDQVLMALIALVGTSIAALVYVIRNGRYVKTAAQQATEANAAVNSVGPDKHTIYAMVENIRDDVIELRSQQATFDAHGWETLPDDLNSAVKLTTTIRDLQRHSKECSGKLDTILGELRGHVEWEMNTKYNDHL